MKNFILHHPNRVLIFSMIFLTALPVSALDIEYAGKNQSPPHKNQDPKEKTIDDNSKSQDKHQSQHTDKSTPKKDTTDTKEKETDDTHISHSNEQDEPIISKNPDTDQKDSPKTNDIPSDDKSAQSNMAQSDRCHQDALGVNIKHFKYDEAKKSDLVWSGYGSKNEEKYLIHKQAKPALDEMIKAARKDGVTLRPNSIFRSVNRQKRIINNKLKSQKLHEVYYISSPAGYSEHHTGLAMDFNSIDKTFDKSKAYRWLVKNAAKFGFEQTFTKEYSEWSGVSEETWHWRYIGKDGEFLPIFQASIDRQC